MSISQSDVSRHAARPGNDRSQVVLDLLHRLWKAIEDAPPEEWTPPARHLAREMSGRLAGQLSELERSDRLAMAVPCHHPRCDLKVIALCYGRILSPENAAPEDWWHIDANGNESHPRATVDGEVHLAAPRQEGQG